MERANLLSEAEAFPYPEDYYGHLLIKEDQRFQRYQFQARSPQLSFRKDLITSLKRLHDKLGLGLDTYHLAVHLLDIFMDCHEIDQKQLMLTASTCLLIAAKYVDVDNNVPRISHLQSLTNYHNSVHEYRIMEMMLLQFWKWDLNFATTLHVLEHLMACNLYQKSVAGLFAGTQKELKCAAIQLANLSLTELTFIYYKSSMIAASCLAAARIKQRILPVWTAELEAITRYSFNDIHECVQVLTRVAQIPTFESYVTVSHDEVLTVYYEEPKVDCKWKVKAYNCARSKRRHLIQPRDLKQMYCAM